MPAKKKPEGKEGKKKDDNKNHLGEIGRELVKDWNTHQDGLKKAHKWAHSLMIETGDYSQPDKYHKEVWFSPDQIRKHVVKAYNNNEDFRYRVHNSPWYRDFLFRSKIRDDRDDLGNKLLLMNELKNVSTEELWKIARSSRHPNPGNEPDWGLVEKPKRARHPRQAPAPVVPVSLGSTSSFSSDENMSQGILASPPPVNHLPSQPELHSPPLSLRSSHSSSHHDPEQYWTPNKTDKNTIIYNSPHFLDSNESSSDVPSQRYSQHSGTHFLDSDDDSDADDEADHHSSPVVQRPQEEYEAEYEEEEQEEEETWQEIVAKHPVTLATQKWREAHRDGHYTQEDPEAVMRLRDSMNNEWETWCRLRNRPIRGYDPLPGLEEPPSPPSESEERRPAPVGPVTPEPPRPNIGGFPSEQAFMEHSVAKAEKLARNMFPDDRFGTEKYKKAVRYGVKQAIKRSGLNKKEMFHKYLPEYLKKSNN
jgi:hypothetical protein